MQYFAHILIPDPFLNKADPARWQVSSPLITICSAHSSPNCSAADPSSFSFAWRFWICWDVGRLHRGPDAHSEPGTNHSPAISACSRSFCYSFCRIRRRTPHASTQPMPGFAWTEVAMCTCPASSLVQCLATRGQSDSRFGSQSFAYGACRRTCADSSYWCAFWLWISTHVPSAIGWPNLQASPCRPSPSHREHSDHDSRSS